MTNLNDESAFMALMCCMKENMPKGFCGQNRKSEAEVLALRKAEGRSPMFLP